MNKYAKTDEQIFSFFYEQNHNVDEHIACNFDTHLFIFYVQTIDF